MCFVYVPGRRILMRRLKTIDEIYDEVKNYGLAITNDIALETALNARISTARIGKLAYTPQHIVEELAAEFYGKPIVTDLELVSNVSKETDLGFRHVYSEILHFREILRHSNDVESNISTKRSRAIYQSYKAQLTVEKAMSEFDPDDPRASRFYAKEGGVAIIGPELFNNLDKCVNSAECDIIDIFTDDDYEIDRIYQVGNDRILADNAVELIDAENPTDFAIVLSASDKIADAVRTALYRRGLPFVNSMNVSDLSQIRDYLRFLTLSMDFMTVRVRDVKEIFSSFNGFFRSGNDEYLLHRLSDSEMKQKAIERRDLMHNIFDGEVTFIKAAEELCNKRDVLTVKMVLEQLGMLFETITPVRLSELRYAVENVQELRHNEQIPEREKHGVLIADCKNSVFVDRPVVIYLGMDQEWNIPVIGKHYLNPEDESERNSNRLEALIQQGEKRIYLTNVTKGGNPARPCLTFDLITGHACEKFENLVGSPDRIIKGRWKKKDRRTMPERCEMEFEDSGEVRSFSKTSFNNYIRCPRMYMFGSLVPSPDKDYIEYGNLIHDFAELYATNREAVNKIGIQSIIDILLEKYSGISSPLKSKLDSQRIALGVKNVARYLDEKKIFLKPNTKNSIRTNPNELMTELGIDEASTDAEWDYDSKFHKIHGKMDLFHDGIITDYKTGKLKKSKDVAINMDFTDIKVYAEFQPMIYLAIAGELEGKNHFRLYFPLGDDIRSHDDSYPIDELCIDISLHGNSVKKFILDTPDGRDVLKDTLKKAFTPHVGEIQETVLKHGNFEKMDDDVTLIPKILRIVGMKFNDTNVEDTAKPALRKIEKLLKQKILVFGRNVYIPEPTLDEFLQLLDDYYDKAVEQSRSCLPAEPADGRFCESCEYRSLCTISPNSIGGDNDE